jgi:16S rRNA (adenine1518-N6/adenine1519-N6)-dimethyltransferase
MVKLGQNFLVDRNIVDVIERLAELDGDQVVLEVGGGEGILSERLAERTHWLHVVEIDAGLEEHLQAVLARFPNVTLHVADALELDLAALEPAPTRVVANLPYSIAATFILRTIEAVPTIQSWLVMVQREVGERLAAGPGTQAYGAPSVLAQIACEVKVVRAIPRTVFRPVPRVDSVLVRLRRVRPGADPKLRALINDAFAHRRKTLAGSLALAPGRPQGIRAQAAGALQAMGRPPDVRAERLAPQEFVQLEARLSEA